MPHGRPLLAALLSAAATAVITACGDGTDSGSGARGFVATTLVADQGPTQADSHLVNGWGLAFNPLGFAWVANAGSSTATLYDGNGIPSSLPPSLTVAIPPGAAGPSRPTGIVFNDTQGFRIGRGGHSAASSVIVVGEGGTVAGWSPAVDTQNAITAFDGAAEGKIYKGLAIATGAAGTLLYATDFHNGVVDVFDAQFHRVARPGAFVDPALPAGYAPFGIQAIDGRLYVSYAMRDEQAHDEVASTGLGAVDVFDTAGQLLSRLVAPGGALNAPWGITLAPANFGAFSRVLLVANVGDGRINGFDPASGRFLGALAGPDGTPLAIAGLWGIAFGNGPDDQPTDTLFFAAGPGDQRHGAYGRIDAH